MVQLKDNEKSLHVEIQNIRNYKVIKSNDLIQKSRFQLSLQEQKIILYLISKIKPEDMELKEYVFEINGFFRLCGLVDGGGENYKYIKQTLKELRDKSIWVTLDDGSETTMAWINSITMNKRSGAVKINIDERMKPYLLQLQERFTSYELLYTLAMRSQYSIRLYELFKSYEWRRRCKFDIDELKTIIFANKYIRFPDFKRKVLDIAMREINDLTDIGVEYVIMKNGRRYGGIEFLIRTKTNLDERLKAWGKIDEIIKL